MPLNFPSSPTANQIYTDSTTGNRYLWDAPNNVWKWTPNTISLSVSALAPGSPSQGSLWWNSDYGRLFIYYVDGDSSQWVDSTPSNDIKIAIDIANAASNIANAAFGVTNTSFSVANAAFTSSNTKASTGKAIAMAMVFGG